MKTEIAKQLTSLSIALLLGFSLGILYDILRPVRRQSGKTGAAVIDALFASVSGIGLFLFAMGAGNGQLGLWELSASFLGFLAYIYTLSDILFPLFSGFFTVLSIFFSKIRKAYSYLEHSMKKNFKILKK
ncbi:MAG: spore cortex biosynthesis protein YabQ [Eubacteriales bacterium]|nr:spore cortex biosynthesis protein YabQ [Eubacteriales bacterium]